MDKMTDSTIQKKPKAINTLDDDIAKAEAKLKKLQDQKKLLTQKELEKNKKFVMDLIKAERLDHVASDIWKKVLPKIKELLISE